jgi:hypothetical protein
VRSRLRDSLTGSCGECPAKRERAVLRGAGEQLPRAVKAEPRHGRSCLPWQRPGVAPRSGWWATSPSRAALSLRLIWKLMALACRSGASVQICQLWCAARRQFAGDESTSRRRDCGISRHWRAPRRAYPSDAIPSGRGDCPSDYRGSCLPVPGRIWPRCRWLPGSRAVCRKASATTSGNRP